MGEHLGIIILGVVSAIYVIARVADQLHKAKRGSPPSEAVPSYRGGLDDCGSHPAINDKEGT